MTRTLCSAFSFSLACAANCPLCLSQTGDTFSVRKKLKRRGLVAFMLISLGKTDFPALIPRAPSWARIGTSPTKFFNVVAAAAVAQSVKRPLLRS